MDELIRINKFLALAGVAARRKADELIKSGKITINGKMATLSDRVDPAKDKVSYGGRELKIILAHRYLVLNKPAGVVSSVSDDRGRKTVIDIVADRTVFPVGRLDVDVTGVLLLTSDGDLAYALTHPKFGAEKVYVAELNGIITADVLEQIVAGVVIEGVKCRAKSAVFVGQTKIGGRSIVKVTMAEGRKREVKNLFKQCGFPVAVLRRESFAGITADGLRTGQFRDLTQREISLLMAIKNRINKNDE